MQLHKQGVMVDGAVIREHIRSAEEPVFSIILDYLTHGPLQPAVSFQYDSSFSREKA